MRAGLQQGLVYGLQRMYTVEAKSVGNGHDLRLLKSAGTFNGGLTHTLLKWQVAGWTRRRSQV